MKKKKRNLLMIVLSFLLLLIFCGCSMTVNISGTKYDIVIENNVSVSISIYLNGEASYNIFPGAYTTFNLREGTVIEVCEAGDPLTKFAIRDVPGDYEFILDGPGYTLSAETGCHSPNSIRVMRVL